MNEAPVIATGRNKKKDRGLFELYHILYWQSQHKTISTFKIIHSRIKREPQIFTVFLESIMSLSFMDKVSAGTPWLSNCSQSRLIKMTHLLPRTTQLLQFTNCLY